MKKTLTKLWMGITLSTSIITFAQTGNVGVNTTTPGSTLDVRGSFAAQYTAVTAAAYAMSATDFFVAYNGTANAAFTLPAAISGTGNFKGRMYTVKNNTSFTVAVSPAGSETINGNTSMNIGAGQSAQFVNTGLTGAAPTWEVVNGSGSSAGGGDYIIVTPGTSQTPGINTDIIFNTTVASNNITNTSGVFTLKAGKTYVLRGQLYALNFSNSNGFLVYQWVDATSNSALPGSVQGVVNASTSTTSFGGQPEAYTLYTPTADQTVKLRVVFASGNAGIHGGSAFATITQLGSGSGSGTSTAGSGDYIVTVPAAAQTGAGTGTDVQFATTIASQNMTNNAGVFTLKAGKTYMLSCQLVGYAFNGTNQYVIYQWVNASTNTPIPNASKGILVASNNSTPFGGHSDARGTFTPSTDMTVKVRITDSNPGTFNIHSVAGSINITQIEGGSSGGGLNTASNGLTAVSDDIKLGGNLAQATSISNNGNALAIAGSASTTTFTPTGNVGVNSSVPGSTLDVKGSFAVQYNDVTAAAYALSATDVFVSYSGAANGTFTLPAAISGAGNFKGRLYKIKNNSSFDLMVNSAGSETINGNTNITIGAGQSAEFVSTGLTGAASTWVVLNGSGSSTAGAGDYIMTVPAADQTNVAVGTDLQFATTVASKNMTNNSGVFTLKAGKTYMLSCQILGYSFTPSNSFIVYQWVNAATNVVIPGGGGGVLHSSGYTDVTFGGQPEARTIYTPSTDTTVKVRFTSGNAVFRTHGSVGSITITQIGNN